MNIGFVNRFFEVFSAYFWNFGSEGKGRRDSVLFFKIGLHTQCAPTDCGGNLTDGFARLRPGHGGSSQNLEGGGRIRLHFSSRFASAVRAHGLRQ